MAEPKLIKLEVLKDGVFYPADVRHDKGAVIEVPEADADALIDADLANLPRPKRH